MGPVMVVVTADRKLLAYQMHPEPKEWQPFQSQLKQQIRNRLKKIILRVDPLAILNCKP